MAQETPGDAGLSADGVSSAEGPGALSGAAAERKPRPVYGIRIFGAPAARFAIQDRGRIVWIDVDDVIRIQADDDYVVIHAGGRRYMAYIRLRELHALLDPGQFLRPHRSHLVNVVHIRRAWAHPGRRIALELSDGTVVISSRRLRGLLKGRVTIRDAAQAG